MRRCKNPDVTSLLLYGALGYAAYELFLKPKGPAIAPPGYMVTPTGFAPAGVSLPQVKQAPMTPTLSWEMFVMPDVAEEIKRIAPAGEPEVKPEAPYTPTFTMPKTEAELEMERREILGGELPAGGFALTGMGRMRRYARHTYGGAVELPISSDNPEITRMARAAGTYPGDNIYTY